MDGRKKNRIGKNAMKMAEYTVKKEHYLRLRTMLVQIILNPECMNAGCHRVEVIRKLMVSAGVNVCYRSVRNYIREVKIKRGQKELNEKNFEALRKLKPQKI